MKKKMAKKSFILLAALFLAAGSLYGQITPEPLIHGIIGTYRVGPKEGQKYACTKIKVWADREPIWYVAADTWEDINNAIWSAWGWWVDPYGEIYHAIYPNTELSPNIIKWMNNTGLRYCASSFQNAKGLGGYIVINEAYEDGTFGSEWYHVDGR